MPLICVSLTPQSVGKQAKRVCGANRTSLTPANGRNAKPPTWRGPSATPRASMMWVHFSAKAKLQTQRSWRRSEKVEAERIARKYELHFVASNAEFVKGDIPATAVFTGDEYVLGDLFTIQTSSVPWGKIQNLAYSDAGKQNFVYKWLEETAQIILAAREGQFIAPQCVLIGLGGRRFRTLLHRARTRGDGIYSCDFLAIEEVGGPLTGLPKRELSLLTAIRMGYRFRSGVIQKFPSDFDTLSPEERQLRIQQIPRTIEDLTVESITRGNITRDDFLAAFEETESERVSKLLDYWPILTRELYKSLGLAPDGRTIVGPGLIGPDVERYRTAFNAMRLVNVELLSRCCACVAQMTKRSEQELSDNARALEGAVRALTHSDLMSSSEVALTRPESRHSPSNTHKSRDESRG